MIVRVSTIETFRRVIETDYQSEAELVARIQGNPDEPKAIMRAGTAWHALLADESLNLLGADPRTDTERHKEAAQLRHAIRHNPPQGEMAIEALEADLDSLDEEPDSIEQDGFHFTANAVACGRQHQGPGLREVQTLRRFDVSGRTLWVSGTCDHIHGLGIRDAKAKFSPADPRDYEPSLQWRLYLLLFGCSVFTYDLCSFADLTDDGHCHLKSIESYRFWPYQGMLAEVEAWLGRFLAWCDGRGVTHHLEAERRSGAA